MAACDTREHPCNFAVCHQLGFFQGLLNALNGRINIDNNASFEAIAGSNSQTHELEFPAGHDLGNHGHDFAGSDVQPNHQIFVFFGHIVTFSSLSSLLCHRR